MFEENHKNEQYFFTDNTREKIVEIASKYAKICCISCPSVGEELENRGCDVTILDIDMRFNYLSGFKYWDIKVPTYIESQFDLIIMDPPFFNVSMTEIRKALKMLTHYDVSNTKLMISYLTRREKALISGLKIFKLKPMGFIPEYNTVDVTDPKREIMFYGN